jgi:hypothetical protein
MSKWVAAAVLVVVATGCNFGNEAQTCTTDQQCRSSTLGAGRCEMGSSLCSFPDSTCGAGGYRFGGLAGDQSGQCVGGTVSMGSDSGIPVDGATDAAIDAYVPDAQTCFGTGLVKVCLVAAPTGTTTFSNAVTINTDSGPCVSLASGGNINNVCVIAATVISVQATVRGTGTRPLVLLATDSINIGALGVIDVGSHRNAADELGAGADSDQCIAGTTLPTVNLSGGGGAGGSFTSAGGTGGRGGANNNNSGIPGVAGGLAASVGFRGGCPGQDGAGVVKGVRGHGGGAVFLIAGNTINLQGSLLATGEGGAGAGANASSGGGGGSGGMIGFDAPAVTGSGLLLASGGGGGGGAGVFATAAQSGLDPTSVDPASGGTAATNGGAGGDGSPPGLGVSGNAGGAGRDSGTVANLGGGGGGGGGAGSIKGPPTLTNSSPTVTQ